MYYIHAIQYSVAVKKIFKSINININTKSNAEKEQDGG